MMLLLYFFFVHIVLFVPGYVAVKNSKLLQGKPGLELCAAYLVSITMLALFAIAGYVFNIPADWLQSGTWLLVGASVALFIQQKIYKDLAVHRVPLAAVFILSAFSLAFISLTYSGPRTYIPDPTFQAINNYDTFNVKVLNIAQTPANDNYVPYRQAQFMVNRSNPGTDSFIDEWGVHFFQRTPLLGAVTAQFFTLLGDKPPIAYLWSNEGQDPERTYEKFQVIGHIMNALFIIPAFLLLERLFNRRTALLSLAFIIPSHFFLYNAFFTWPKSLVAFFILFSWLLLFEKRLRFVLIAGAAGGLAYLTHDLAVFYIGASVLLLLYWKRFRDALITGVLAILFALPWFIVSALIYKKPSSFLLYPFSLYGIPQADQKARIMNEFFSASPFKIIAIKLDSLLYLMSPYQLIFSEGGQAWGRRLWALGLFNIPGALGLGLIAPTLLGAVRKIRNVPFWILALSPILLVILFLGAPRLILGAMHFAEASVVLFIGLGVWFLSTLPVKWWLIGAFIINTTYLAWFMLYSYGFFVSGWFKGVGDIAALLLIAGIIAGCSWVVVKLSKQKSRA